MVLQSFYRYIFGVKVKTVFKKKLMGGRRFLAARSGLDVGTCLPKVIQMMAFTQIMAIWTPGISLQGQLKNEQQVDNIADI